MENVRRIYNPVQKDYATFLKTAVETAGELSLLEVELAPHGGNNLHFHPYFSEGFEVLEGELNVQMEKEICVLQVGEKAVVPPNTNHRFFSTSDQPTRFLVEIRPGHTGFENGLRIIYGLAEDGQLNPQGLPNDLLTLAYLAKTSGMKLRGPIQMMQPVFNGLAMLAERRGVVKQLTERYLQPF